MTAHWEIRVNEYKEDQFWLSRQPLADKDAMGIDAYTSEAVRHKGVERIQHEIYRYNDGGIGNVQWLDWIQDAGVILAGDGDWKTGGAFHAWIAPASGRPPYELERIAKSFTYPAGDPNRWQSVKAEAVHKLCELTGLPVPPDFAK